MLKFDMKKTKKIEIFLLLLYWFLISALALILKFRYLEMAIFFSGVPAAYLLIRNHKYSSKIPIRSFLFMIPAIIVFEIFGHISRAWYESSIFSFRVFGIFPLESFLWGINYFILTVSFYEYFFDRPNKPQRNPIFLKILILAYIGMTLTLAFLIFVPSLLSVPYFYTLFLVLILLLTILVSIKCPKIFKKALPVSLIGLLPALLHEFVSLELGHWSFEKGYHLAYIEILNHTLPIEELIWLPLLPIWIVLFYEFTMDDFK